MYTSTSLASNVHVYKPCLHNTSILTIWHLNVIMEWLWTRNPTRKEWMTSDGSWEPFTHSSWLSTVIVRLMDKLWKSWMISHLRGWKLGQSLVTFLLLDEWSVMGANTIHVTLFGSWVLITRPIAMKIFFFSLRPVYNRHFTSWHVTTTDMSNQCPTTLHRLSQFICVLLFKITQGYNCSMRVWYFYQVMLSFMFDNVQTSYSTFVSKKWTHE